jgi:uncharacterized protein
VPEERPQLLRVLSTATVVVICALIGFRLLNQWNVFPPVPKDSSIAPAQAQARDDAREVTFRTADGVELYGWVQGSPRASRRIIQFMGNGEYVGPNAAMYGESCRVMDVQFLLFDWRGFANSGGRPSERGFYTDARAAWDFAVHELGWPPSEIILWGRSLGGGVATRLALELIEADVPPAAVILEAAFTSIQDMAFEVLPVLVRPDWLAYSRFDNLSRAPKLELPVMLIHGTEDEIVPFEMSERLYAALPGPKQLLALQGRHNDLWSSPAQTTEIRTAIDRFLQRNAA